MRCAFIVVNRKFKDLNPINLGREDCSPSHSFGPYVRKYTLIHYVVSGCGILYKNGKEYPVHAGEAFLILPGEVTVYRADRENPWNYRWVGFDGELSGKFWELPPVFPAPEGIFRDMMECGEHGELLEYRVSGLLFSLYAELFSQKKHGNHYVSKVMDYIKAEFMQDIKVEQIARNMNLDRRYLSRLFKSRTGQTIQEYLISVRMEEACNLLSKGYGVGEVAALCGYADPGNFSKMFKKHFSVSPANWKQEE